MRKVENSMKKKNDIDSNKKSPKEGTPFSYPRQGSKRLRRSDKDIYLAQFLERIEKASGRNGIPSSRLGGIENAAERLLEKCESACELHDYRQAFYMASAVAEAMVETMNSTTDDCVDESDILDRAIEFLKIISGEVAEKRLHAEIFSYLISNCFGEPFNYAIDGEQNALESLIRLISNRAEKDQVKKLIEQYCIKRDTIKFYADTFQVLMKSMESREIAD
jgi:hypothetical protein